MVIGAFIKVNELLLGFILHNSGASTFKSDNTLNDADRRASDAPVSAICPYFSARIAPPLHFIHQFAVNLSSLAAVGARCVGERDVQAFVGDLGLGFAGGWRRGTGPRGYRHHQR